MKRILLISLIFLAACEKAQIAELTTQEVTIEPKITNVDFFPTYAGSNESCAFDVDLISDSNKVAWVKLYLAPDQLRWEVKKPQTGRHRMYDHVGDMPLYNQFYYYYFVFEKNDGTKVTTEQFQVY